LRHSDQAVACRTCVDTEGGGCYNKAPLREIARKGFRYLVHANYRRRGPTMTLGEIDTINRQRRQLTDAAISHATRGEWDDAARANQELLELGPDTDAYNRLGKALAELGRDDEALAAYRSALERDSTNRIAERNVARLEVLLASRQGDAKRTGTKMRVAK